LKKGRNGMRKSKHNKLAQIEKALEEVNERSSSHYIPYDVLLDFWKKVKKILEEDNEE